MKIKGLLPNGLTFANLFLGFLSIILIAEGKFVSAAWLIILSSILDGLDGAAARLTKQSSAFGMEADSFADVISFGVAPSLLVYKVCLENLGLGGVLLAFIPLMAGVYRLVRFKFITTSKPKFRGFVGLPIPAYALIAVSYYLFQYQLNNGFVEGLLYISLLPALALLMISPIPYRRMPVFPLTNTRYPWIGILVLGIATLSVILFQGVAMFPIMVFYLITGPVEAGYLQLRRLNKHILVLKTNRNSSKKDK